MEDLAPATVNESLLVLARLMEGQGAVGAAILEGPGEQVRGSVTRYLAPWVG